MTKESYNFGVDTEAKRLYTETSRMTKKRFTINNDIDFNDKIETYELNCIVDNENKTFYFIADSIENVQLFVKRLNGLYEENHKIKSILLKRVEELNDAYNKSAKAGMPTGGIIGELDSFEEICEAMGWLE